jgi:prevent-host-death family protein
MPQIRPISDLRNNFAEISRIVHETPEPVFLTKNGYGDMVVMSVELFEQLGIAAILLEQKPKKPAAPVQEAKEAPQTDLKIQKPLSLWQKTLSDLVSKS